MPSTVVGAYDAKTHLSELLERASQGERITITRHGTPVAMLGPVQSARSASVSETIAKIRAFRKGRTLDLPLAELIREGRR